MKTSSSRNPGKSAVTPGTDNVFADLGFGTEAAELKVKAELTRQICNRIKSMSMTQTAASTRLGISQPDVSKLMKGRYVGFSVDRLLGLLNSLEVDVDIVVKPRIVDEKHSPGVVRVMELLPN